MDIIPKKENEGVGFRYHVTMEQMLEHQKKSTDEILEWIEEHAAFLQSFQTDEDRERIMKNKKKTLD